TAPNCGSRGILVLDPARGTQGLLARCPQQRDRLERIHDRLSFAQSVRNAAALDVQSFPVAAVQSGKREVPERVGVFGVDAQCSLVVPRRGFVMLELEQRIGAPRKAVGVAGLDLKGGVVAGPCLLRASQVEE